MAGREIYVRDDWGRLWKYTDGGTFGGGRIVCQDQNADAAEKRGYKCNSCEAGLILLNEMELISKYDIP